MHRRLFRRLLQHKADGKAHKVTFDIVLISLRCLPPGIRQVRLQLHRGRRLVFATSACAVRNGAQLC